jgi:hypothetical protein
VDPGQVKRKGAVKGARLCAKHQPQHSASNALPEIPWDSLLAKRCGWSFRHSRAPKNPRAVRGFGLIAELSAIPAGQA